VSGTGGVCGGGGVSGGGGGGVFTLPPPFSPLKERGVSCS